jgi:hypothetical protein
MPDDYADFATNTTMRWLPDQRVVPYAASIEERVGNFAGSIRAATFMEFLDPLMKRLIVDSYRGSGAHEGVIWLLDREQKNLLCACQVGTASRKLSRFVLPLESGVSGMVMATQQPFCENNLSANRAAASVLEERMGVIVCSRVLVPFFIAGTMRGIVSAYLTKPTLDAPEPQGFDTDAVEEISLLARLLTRLFDHKLLCAAIGLEED